MESKLEKYIDLYCTGDEDVPSTDESKDFENYLMMDIGKLKYILPDPWILSQKTDMPLINLKDLE